jgi:integrase
MTFKQAATQYIESHKAGWSNAKHVKQWSSTLAESVYPIIGGMPVSQITGRAGVQKIREIFDPLWRRTPATAMRVRGRVEMILDWCKANHYLNGDNCARWKGNLDSIYPHARKVQPVKHHAALPYAALPDFMRRLRALDGRAPRALEFTILTAARTSEVLKARWSEIDKEGRLWVVPAERMKMKRPHRQPLSDRAMAILRALPKDDSGLIFPGRKKGRPLEGKALQRVLQGLKVDAVPHGFRSSFRDWGAELGNYPN